MEKVIASGRLGQLKSRKPFLIGLWIGAILLYGVGDLVTTNLVLANGGRELNLVFASMSRFFGGNIWGSIIVKIIVIGCLVAIYRLGVMKRHWVIPGILSLVGGGLVAGNLISYLHM